MFTIQDASLALTDAFKSLTGIQMGDDAQLSDSTIEALSSIQANSTDFVDFQIPKIIAVNAEFETMDSNKFYAGPRFMESLYVAFNSAGKSVFHTTNMSPVTIPLSGNDTPLTKVYTGDNVLGTFYKIVPKVNTMSNVCDITVTNEIGDQYRLRPIDYDKDVYIFVPRGEQILVGDFTTSNPNPDELVFTLGANDDTSHFTWAIGKTTVANTISASNAQVWTRPLFVQEQGVALTAAMIAFGMGEAMLNNDDFSLYATTLVTGMLVGAFNNPDSYNADNA